MPVANVNQVTRQQQVVNNNQTSSNSRIQQNQTLMQEQLSKSKKVAESNYTISDAQEFNSDDYFTIQDDYTLAREFSKEGYNVEFYPDGKTIKRIWQNPKEYTSYYKNPKEGKTRREKSTYIPHEIIFDKSGMIIKEVKRDDYRDYEKSTDDYSKYTRKVYDNYLTEYNSDGTLKTKKIYNDYAEKDKKSDDSRREYRDVYLKEDYDYSAGTKKSYSKPQERVYNTTSEYIAKQQAKAQSQYDSAMQKYNNATTQAEKNRIASQYGLKWSVTTPDGKTYTSSNQEFLQNKYSEYFANETTAQRNKRYVDMINEAWQTGDTNALQNVKTAILKENPELYVQELQSTKQGRQQLVNEGYITGVEDNYNKMSRMLTNQELQQYIDTGKIQTNNQIFSQQQNMSIDPSFVEYQRQQQAIQSQRNSLIEKYYGNLPEHIVQNMKANAEQEATVGKILSGRSTGDTYLDAFNYASNNNFKALKEGNLVYQFPFTVASIPDELYNEELTGKQNLDQIYREIQAYYGINSENPTPGS